MAEAKNRLNWNYTRCDGHCEHLGAAFTLILEEKMQLGLSKPPTEREPVESLSEEELVAQALADRKERAKVEKFELTAASPNKPKAPKTTPKPSEQVVERVRQGLSNCI